MTAFDSLEVGIVGGGPAGLYSAILLKKAVPGANITVVEKNPRGVTWGWGVVFSEQTITHFAQADAESYAAICAAFARWDTIDTHFKGRCITSGGHDFTGLRRVKLLDILTARAEELGVKVEFDVELDEHSTRERFAGCDLIIIADGVNSRLRNAYEQVFKPTITPGKAKFIWLGSTKLWDAFTFLIRENEHGLFQVHAYRFDVDTSTFIVECDEQTWRNAGLDEADEAQSIAYCEKLFAEELGGAKLLGNRSRWINFPELRCESWQHENMVLIGDAAHTAHFSIGSGTKLAMEDAIELVATLTEQASREGGRPIPESLRAYQDRRGLDVAKLQRAASVSQKWFEDISRYKHFEPEQFVASMMTRSKRVTHENLRIRDAAYVEQLDRWFAAHVGHPVADDQPPPPPMFQPFQLADMTLENRVVVSPMCMYSATDGVPNDWHLVHIGSRATGGAGLVMCEMTDVSPEARISPGCTGLWSQAHADGWKRVVDYVHQWSRAKIGVQLGHAGRKGATGLLWHGAKPLPPEQAWPLVAPSPLAWDQNSQTPRELTRADMTEIREQFVRATKHALAAGFDMIEVHAAHGYLLASFISPLTNQRSDDYGGTLAKRMRFPLEVFDACREAWPSDKPMSVRISATDWMPGGLSEDEAVEVARMFHEHGCQLIDVSAGQTDPGGKPIYGRMFQTPFSDRIRNELRDIATMAVGNIQGWDHINTIVVSGRADLCALARPHLYDPYLTLHAAAEQGWHRNVRWPDQYIAARSVADLVAANARIED